MALYFIERREQRPCFKVVALFASGGESEDPAAATLRSFKAEDGFDRIGAGAGYLAGRGPILVYLETSRARTAGMHCKLSQDRIRTADRLEMPGQGQQVVVNSLQEKFKYTSGVNIDQEMANLLQIQTAYGANARVLSAIKDMKNQLLQV